MRTKLTLCLVALCMLSSGCNLVLSAARNIRAECRDRWEDWQEEMEGMRPSADDCPDQGSIPIGGKAPVVSEWDSKVQKTEPAPEPAPLPRPGEKLPLSLPSPTSVKGSALQPPPPRPPEDQPVWRPLSIP
jgi:hypothetical protein